MTDLSLYELQNAKCRDLELRARILSAKVRRLERIAEDVADPYSGEIEGIYAEISSLELEHHTIVLDLIEARAALRRTA